MRHGRHAPLLLGARHEPAVVGAGDGGLERALEFLRVLLLGQVAPGERKLAFRNEGGVARLEHEGKPVLLRLRTPPQREEGVAALGRADEHRPAGAVGERRADDFRPHARIHVGVFIEHHAVEIDAAQRVGIVGAVEAHLAAAGIIGAQLALMHARAHIEERRDRAAQIIPRHRLRLLKKGREIGEAGAQARAGDGRALQLVNTRHRLAGAAMGHGAGEALAARMEAEELLPLAIVEHEAGWLRRIFCLHEDRGCRELNHPRPAQRGEGGECP